jgi:hypothetical protein
MPFGYEVKEQEKKNNEMHFSGYKKKYVDVQCLYTKEPKVIPLIIYFDEYHKYEVDKVIDVRKGASLKVGGQGLRFTVRVCGKETFLFYDSCDNKWFVEEKPK